MQMVQSVSGLVVANPKQDDTHTNRDRHDTKGTGNDGKHLERKKKKNIFKLKWSCGWDRGLGEAGGRQSTGRIPHTCPLAKTSVTVNFTSRQAVTDICNLSNDLETNASCPRALCQSHCCAAFLCT